MKNKNRINEEEFGKRRPNSFVKIFNKKINVFSLKHNSINNQKSKKHKLIRNCNIAQINSQTISKLPNINYNKNPNYNTFIYIRNSNNQELNTNIFQKNNLFNYESMLQKNKNDNNIKKGIKLSKNNTFTKLKDKYQKIEPKFIYQKNKFIFEGNFTNINRNNRRKIFSSSVSNKMIDIYNNKNNNGETYNTNLNKEIEKNKQGNLIKKNHLISSVKNFKRIKFLLNQSNIKKNNYIYNIINKKIIIKNDHKNFNFHNEFFNSEIQNNLIDNHSKSEKCIFKSDDKIKIVNELKEKEKRMEKKEIAKNLKNKNYFIVYPGNNGQLIERCILTRENWDKLPKDKKNHESNLLWTPLSIQINYNFHKAIEESHIVNHFENHKHLTNKRNIFINLLKYCESNNINLFSFYPLTIIISLNNDYFDIEIENFKKCYFDLPNLVEDLENKNGNFLDKHYKNYFNIYTDKKLGSIQKLIIPKSHYAGKNLWLIKKINLNRGREIQVMSNLDQIIQQISQIKNEQKKLKYLIIQKYIEKPLLYCGRKFDIRIWVLFTYLLKTNKFEAYVFKEGHLKASSEIFDINSLDLYIHLTNYSVQKNNKNFSKNEIGNEISFNTFQKELDKNGDINFKKNIFENIIKIIEITANIAKNKINVLNRKNCFELFGYDFILDENYKPFLLEINTNPGFEESSPLIKMLIPRMIDDALRLTIDKVFENNDNYKHSSQFKVDGYNNEENMWQKIKV